MRNEGDKDVEERDKATPCSDCLEVVVGWLKNLKVKEEEMRGLTGMDLVYYRSHFIFGVLCVYVCVLF